MRRLTSIALVAGLLLAPAPAFAGQSTADRISDLQDELDSLREDIEDLQEPVEEFELFDQCAYLIGVTQRPDYLYGPSAVRRRALAFDLRGFGRAQFTFLAFPAEEPPSIECNEDAGEEDSDD